MKPVNFKESNKRFVKGSGMNNVGHLMVLHDREAGEIVSKWKAPFWQRIKFLFHGYIWVTVKGSAMAPIKLDCTNEIFKKNRKINLVAEFLLVLFLSFLLIMFLSVFVGTLNFFEWPWLLNRSVVLFFFVTLFFRIRNA